jgi:hypothetical protein
VAEIVNGGRRSPATPSAASPRSTRAAMNSATDVEKRWATAPRECLARSAGVRHRILVGGNLRLMADPKGFVPFYQQEAEAVLFFLTRRTLDAEVALDLTAETFAQAWRGWPILRSPGDGLDPRRSRVWRGRGRVSLVRSETLSGGRKDARFARQEQERA